MLIKFLKIDFVMIDIHVLKVKLEKMKKLLIYKGSFYLTM